MINYDIIISDSENSLKHGKKHFINLQLSVTHYFKNKEAV